MRARNLPNAELASRYQAGASLSLLALYYDCSHTVIARRLRALGVTLRPPRRREIDVSREELERLYVQEGLTLPEIAQRLGVSRSTVGKKRREFGLPALRRPGQGR